jgi:hypothetical protein
MVDWYLPLILLCAISRAAIQSDQRLVLKTREEVWWLTSNHVRGHTIANEQDQVLGLPRWRNVADEPIGHGGGAIVVAQCRSVLSWLGENYIPICFAGHLDQRRCLSVLGKSIYLYQPCMANNPKVISITFKPSKVPGLQLWLGHAEEVGCTLSFAAGLLDGKSETRVRCRCSCRLAAVDRSVHFQPYVEPLTR